MLRRGSFASVFVILLSLPAVFALAENAPDRSKAESPASDVTELNQLLPLILDVAPENQGVAIFELQFLAPVSAEDRGSSFTDAGLGSVNDPNAIERAKLAMARAAIEASRVAGTLIMPALPGPVLPPAPADIEPIKLERYLNPAPIAVPEMAGPDGIGGGLNPIQEIGSDEPTAEELAKLQQSWPATPNSKAPASVEPAAQAEPRAAESAERKEVRE